MTQSLPLRPYQTECIQAVEEAWDRNILRPSAVLATGLGKTVIFSHLAKRWMDLPSNRFGFRRVLVLAHRDELVKQAAAKVKGVAPDLNVGIVKASENQVDADVVVASIQTLATPRRLEQLDPGDDWLVVVDECHHAVARSYRYVMDHFDGACMVGFTATMSRGDSLGLGDVWQEIVYSRDISWGIRHGHLADVRGLAVTVERLDLSEVKRSRGDFQDGDLGEALVEAEAGEVVAKAVTEEAAERQGVLFAPSVASAEHFAQALSDADIATELVTGSTPIEERQRIFSAYRAGDVRVLANCMVLTEGWDMPQASLCVVARPTSHAGLYQQMVGRVLRPSPGKTDALVLDISGAATRHSLVGLSDLSTTTVRPGESLAEAMDRELEEAATAAERLASAPIERVVTHEIDLFAQSDYTWLCTRGGVWFLSLGDQMIFLAGVGEGLYDVGLCPSKSLRGGRWLHREVPLDMAMSWGEVEARQADPIGTYSNKGASWRKGQVRPSSKQLDLAAGLRIDGAETMTKRELSDAISVHFASRVLDQKVKP